MKSMGKGIGFNRNIKLDWLNATAAFRAETDDPTELRAWLTPIINQQINDPDNIRKAIDILINIWHKNRESAPVLFDQALELWDGLMIVENRIWLHYGLTMLAFPFFCQVTSVIGSMSRLFDDLNNSEIQKRMVSELGELGSLKKAVTRITFSLRDWGIMIPGSRRYAYIPVVKGFSTGNLNLEAWLLSCALATHPVDELPFNDLTVLPTLFPFCFTITVNDLRSLPGFEVQRQGISMDMVRSTL